MRFALGREKKQVPKRCFLTLVKNEQKCSFFFGAGGGSRTHTSFRTQDFKSCASAIPPHQHIKLSLKEFHLLLAICVLEWQTALVEQTICLRTPTSNLRVIPPHQLIKKACFFTRPCGGTTRI